MYYNPLHLFVYLFVYLSCRPSWPSDAPEVVPFTFTYAFLMLQACLFSDSKGCSGITLSLSQPSRGIDHFSGEPRLLLVEDGI